MMCFHSPLSESVYLHVPTSKNAAAPSKRLVVSSDLPPPPPLVLLLSLPPSTSCSLAVRSHLSYPSPLSSSSPPPFPLLLSPLPGGRRRFPLVRGQSSTLFFLLLLPVSCSLELSGRRAKTLLSPPHLPTMNGPFFSPLFISSSAVVLILSFPLFLQKNAFEFSHLSDFRQ